jgi:phage tail tape-measure protein
MAEGTAVGDAVGTAVGPAVGDAVGTAVGPAVGDAVGEADGCAVGTGLHCEEPLEDEYCGAHVRHAVSLVEPVIGLYVFAGHG